MPDFNEFNHLNNASTRYRSFANNGYMHYPGSNGISGFKQWECYMLLKYGKPRNNDPSSPHKIFALLKK